MFEYGVSPSYGQATVPSAPIGSDEVPHGVSNEISELAAGATYHFRVVATNFGGTSYSADHTFSTPGPPAIEAASTSGLTSTSATLEAKVRAVFSPTTYHFEYGTGTSYGAITPEGPSIGADNVAHAVSQAISGLAPGTTYHFRLVATNGVGTTAGPDQTFKTDVAAVPPPQPSPPVKCKKGTVKKHGKCVKKKKQKKQKKKQNRRGESE